MKTIFLLALLACVVAAAQAKFVCNTDYCKTNPCSAPVAQSSCRKPSEFRPNHSGKCACCPACVTLLSEGQACKTYSKEVGETPSAICRDPLKCLTGVCTKVTPRG